MSRQDRVPVPAPHIMGRPHLDGADIVVVGNGIAGLTAALEARRYAPDKRIVIVTEQVHPTINTPALKQFAIGKLERDQLLAYPAGTERVERIHVVTAHVDSIHSRGKFVELDGGRGFGYGSLLLATGSKPNGLPADLPGRNFDGVLTLHRLQDYLDLRRRTHEASEAVVIGGGVHAIETVMGLLYRGIRVHWLIRSKTFMPRMLDETASEMVLDGVRRAGAHVYTENEVVGIVGRIGVVAGVITNQQELIPCQLVLVCTGTQPVSTLAEHCDVSIKSKNGILVDDHLCTNVPDIYAAGDVAALRNPQTEKHETRPQWYSAVLQGRIVGAMMVGQDLQQQFGVQWHATHLGELSMLTVGDPMVEGKGVIKMVDSSQGGYRRMTIVNDRLAGYLSLGASQPDSMAIKSIIEEGHSVRSIAKVLLKGNFDARKYLSQLRSQAAHSMLTTGKTTTQLQNPPSQVQLLPMTTVKLSSAELAPATQMLSERDTEPLQDEILTAVPYQFPEEVEEISSFTGNLPSLNKIVESIVVPEPAPLSSTTRSLWSYSQKMPSVNSNTVQSNLRSSEEEQQEDHLVNVSQRSSLWSYAKKGPKENEGGSL